MYDLFNLLRTPRQRVIAQRQIVILKTLLGAESIEWQELMRQLNADLQAFEEPHQSHG